MIIMMTMSLIKCKTLFLKYFFTTVSTSIYWSHSYRLPKFITLVWRLKKKKFPSMLCLIHNLNLEEKFLKSMVELNLLILMVWYNGAMWAGSCEYFGTKIEFCCGTSCCRAQGRGLLSLDKWAVGTFLAWSVSSQRRSDGAGAVRELSILTDFEWHELMELARWVTWHIGGAVKCVLWQSVSCMVTWAVSFGGVRFLSRTFQC